MSVVQHSLATWLTVPNALLAAEDERAAPACHCVGQHAGWDEKLGADLTQGGWVRADVPLCSRDVRVQPVTA